MIVLVTGFEPNDDGFNAAIAPAARSIAPTHRVGAAVMIQLEKANLGGDVRPRQRGRVAGSPVQLGLTVTP